MKTKKVLAAFLSAAMVLTSMAVPVFADGENAGSNAGGSAGGSTTVTNPTTPGTTTTTPATTPTNPETTTTTPATTPGTSENQENQENPTTPATTMTFDAFVEKIEKGESVGTETGRITVTWSPVSGCRDNRGESGHTCIANNTAATTSTPMRVNSELAQFHIAKDIEKNVVIKNVDFKYNAGGFSTCLNSGWKGTFTAEQAPTAQLYFLNNGDVTVSGCTFDNVVLTARNDQLKTDKKVSITGCEFNNVKNSYGIKEAHGSDITISNNKFNACRSGVMISGDKNISTAKVNITGNEFNCIGDAQKGDLIQIAGDCNFDTTSTLEITNNKSTTDTPVFRLENKDIKGLTFSDNTIPKTAPATSGESKFGATFKDGALDIQTWSGTTKDENNKEKKNNVRVVGGETYATLKEALIGAYTSKLPEPITIECKANADVGEMTHGHVADSIIIEGNGAHVSYNKSCEGDLEIDTYKFNRETGNITDQNESELNKNITVTVNNLNGIGAWGQRRTGNTVTLKFNNCKNMTKIMFRSGNSEAAGKTVVELNNCSFDKSANQNTYDGTSVHITSEAEISLKNCEFNNISVPINLSNKTTKNQNITIENCTFKNCSPMADTEKYAAPIRLVTTSTGKINANVTNVTMDNITTTHGDILLGDGREGNDSTQNVTLTISGTDATVKTEYPGKPEATQEHKVTKDSTSTIEMTGAAKIGDKSYLTLTDALAEVKDGETVTLLNNFTESITIPAGKSITLDLNGYTLTNKEGKHTIENYGTLTIVDSSEKKTGVVDNISHGKGALFNAEKATAVLNGGTFRRSAETGKFKDDNSGETESGGNSWYTIANLGVMTINKDVTVENKGVFSSNIVNGYFDTAGSETPKLTINGGIFTGGVKTVKVDERGELIINGGEFTNEYFPCVMNWNKTEINGGTFTSPKSNSVFNGKFDENTAVGNLTISGGTFNGGLINSEEYPGGNISINGGTFSEDVSEYCVDGYVASKNSDGTYSVLVQNKRRDDNRNTDRVTPVYTNPTYTKDIFGVEHKSHNAYINGYADGTVKPDGNITREELATILYRVSNDASAVVASGDKFNDVSADRWSANAIEFMASKKVVNGYEDGSFKPENNLTRGEFAAMIARFANLTDTAASRTFSDVDSSYWGFKNIMALNKAGYINGYEDGTFRPEANVTRAEVMTVINKIIGRSADASYVNSLDNNKFSDLDKNAWYYVDVMEATTDHNYTLNKSGVETEWSK